MKFGIRLEGVVFSSHGCKLLGVLYGAAGDTPRPTVVLLHGVPGFEKNLDLAYALRDAGWNTLCFHYRGCWGSEGSFSMDGIVEDVRAATEWVRTQPSVDKERLVLIGMSGGGYAALAAGAADTSFKALVALSPLIDPAEATLSVGGLNEMATFMRGVTGAQLKDQFDRLPSIMKVTAGLNDRKILLITGDLDELLPPNHFRQFVKDLPEVTWHRLPPGDHYLSACRKELVEIVMGWLKEACI